MTEVFPLLLAALAAALVAVLSATGHGKPKTGTRIALDNPPTTFAAGAPFYMEQSFACDLGGAKCVAQEISSNGNFDLYVDGVQQPSRVDVEVRDDVITMLHLANFASGLPAGTHRFVEVWYQNDSVVQARAATIIFT
jgi:hypothetical protein